MFHSQMTPDQQQALMYGLLGFGTNMLAESGPRRGPNRFAPAFGRSVQAGVGAAQGSSQDALRRRLAGYQLKKLDAEQRYRDYATSRTDTGGGLLGPDDKEGWALFSSAYPGRAADYQTRRAVQGNKAPTTRSMVQGGETVETEWNPQTRAWEPIEGFRGSRWKPGDRAGGLTTAQQRHNEKVRGARRTLGQEGFSRERVLELARSATDSGRANAEFNPFIRGLATTAADRLYGDDPEHAIYMSWLYTLEGEGNPPGYSAPAQPPPPPGPKPDLGGILDEPVARQPRGRLGGRFPRPAQRGGLPAFLDRLRTGGPPQRTPTGTSAGTSAQELRAEAKRAIAQGADPAAVNRRLRELLAGGR